MPVALHVSQWTYVVLVALLSLFVYAVAALVLTTKHPGDRIMIRLLPPKIEIDTRTSSPTETAELQAARGTEGSPKNVTPDQHERRPSLEPPT